MKSRYIIGVTSYSILVINKTIIRIAWIACFESKSLSLLSHYVSDFSVPQLSGADIQLGSRQMTMRMPWKHFEALWLHHLHKGRDGNFYLLSFSVWNEINKNKYLFINVQSSASCFWRPASMANSFKCSSKINFPHVLESRKYMWKPAEKSKMVWL